MQFFDTIQFCFNSCLLLMISTAILLIFWWWKKPHEEFPPGPRGLPVLGVLPFLGKNPQHTFREWALFYGPVMSVRLGDKDIVFLNTYEAINEALVKQGSKFSGRPPLPFVNQVRGNTGLTYVDFSPKQKLMKTAALQLLKGLSGHGKTKLENIISEETQLLINYLSSKQNQPLNLGNQLVGAFSNIMTKLILGKRLQYEEQTLKTIIKEGVSKPEDAKLHFFLMYFHEYLCYMPPFRGANQRFVKGEQKAAGALISLIENRSSDISNDEGDFVDSFSVFETGIASTTHNHSSSNGDLEGCVRDIVIDGADDLKILLEWDILCLLTYPNYYQVIMHELTTTIGDNEPPSMTHLHSMPTTHAFLQEVWRYCPVAPNGVMHRTTNDAKLNGFLIPKGTHIIPNIYAAHFDPKIWKDPMKFDPQRHIDEDGKFVRSYKIIPCGIGARFCLGRDILHVEEFIVLASLLRQYHISPASFPLPPINSGVSTLVYTPHHYEVILTKRKKYIFPSVVTS